MVAVVPHSLRVLCVSAVLGGALLVGEVQAQHARSVTQTVEIDPDGAVEVVTTTGRIQVSAWDRSAVQIEARIEGGDSSRVHDLEVQIEGDGRHVSVTTENADPDGPGLLDLIGFGSSDDPEAHVVLRMPATASLTVTTEEAGVEVQGLDADVTVEASSSPVSLSDLAGQVIVGTFSGAIRAENVRGELTAGTFSGNLHLRMPSSPPTSQIGSVSGDAEIVLPTGAAFDLSTDITWGEEITSDFELPTGASDGPISVGGGGSQITYESFTGTLTLRAE